MTDRLDDAIKKLAKLARKSHYSCADAWYSCPLDEDGCANENSGIECNCGADEHNKEVDAIVLEIDNLRKPT